MKLFTWDDGRQLSGYRKMLLATSKLLKFDVYILKIPDGAGVPKHRDPVAPGYEHHRINIDLKRGAFFGNVVLDGPFKTFLFGRILYFRPDIVTHWVLPNGPGFGHMEEWLESPDSSYILSIGWLKKNSRSFSQR